LGDVDKPNPTLIPPLDNVGGVEVQEEVSD